MFVGTKLQLVKRDPDVFYSVPKLLSFSTVYCSSVPTTAGTGSETTGVAIFDFEPLKAKTGNADSAFAPPELWRSQSAL